MYSKGCLSEPSDSYTGLRVPIESHTSQRVLRGVLVEIQPKSSQSPSLNLLTS